MFTGIVKTRGTIRRIEKKGDTVMVVAPEARLELALGDSVSCNGICLTVAAQDKDSFTVSLSAETLKCTTAKRWKEGDLLNLEPALALGDPMGGHFVSGHVDALATAISGEKQGDSVIWTFQAPLNLLPFIAPKGSITLDGVSLTVNEVSGDSFTVNVIPHTRDVTGFKDLGEGDQVNLEIDMLARYVARMHEASA